MDHLPLPANPLHPVFEARLSEAEEYYDGLDFASYPERQGWGARTAKDWLDLFQNPTRPFTSLIERWLLFGPIFSVLGHFYTPSDFIRFSGEPAYPIYTTQCFPELLRLVTGYIQLTGRFPGNVSSVQGPLGFAAFLQISLAKSGGDEPVPWEHLSIKSTLSHFLRAYFTAVKDPRDPDVATATAVTIESLAGITSGHYRHVPFDQLPSTLIPTTEGCGGPMWRRLRRDGWCPSELGRLFKQFNTSCIFFIYNLARPAAHESHPMIRVRRGSKAEVDSSSADSWPDRLCNVFECAHKQLREEEYRTRHADGCAGCDEVVADPSELREFLEEGKIPLILSIGEGDDNPGIVFVEAEPGMTYVAISHVWSDGLGNLQRNALPRCQLLRLSSMIRNLPGRNSNTLLFWCDTICIPPDSAGMAEVQSLALGQMRSIYADAAAVLVLDSWLFTSQLKDRSHAETIMKILCCNWNTRLWTYQEGALAKSLLFQFSDGSYDLDAGTRELRRSATPAAKLTIVQQLLCGYHFLRGFRDQKTREEKLTAIAVALGARTTSVVTDEALCLAVLLDLDVTEIARTKPALRMEKFWRMLPTVPESIPFMTMPTMSIDGLRWAPITFLRSRLKSNPYGNPTGQAWAATDAVPAPRTERGMFLESAGIRFVCGTGRIGTHIRIRDENGVWFEVQFYYRRADGSAYHAPVQRPGTSPITISPYDTYGCQEVAILGDFGSHPPPYIRGILVCIDKEEGGTTYCRRLLFGSTTTLREPGDAREIRDLSMVFPGHTGYEIGLLNNHGDESIFAIAGRTVPESQRWCIG